MKRNLTRYWLQIFFATLLIFNIPRSALAQGFPVTGTVTDTSGAPLAGVTIQVKGTQTRTVSKPDGTFSITAPNPTSTLIISYVGFTEQQLPLASQGQVAVEMTPTGSSLQDVVVVGYGTKRRGDVTGAIATVSSEKIKAVPVTNVTQALQGRVPGVDANMSSFRPGAGATVRIRGNRSLGATNEPLYVVDGIPQSYSIDDINPLDIESMDVLKDASATAIYGVRGANGVIQITTKKGRAGRVAVEYSGSVSQDKILRKMKVFDGPGWAQYRRDAYISARAYNTSQGTAIPSLYFPDPATDYVLFRADPNVWQSVAMGYNFSRLDPTNNIFVYQKRATSEAEKTLLRNLGLAVLDSVAQYDPSKVRSTDWADQALRTGLTTNHQLSVTGGSEKFRSSVSGSYFKQKGIEFGQDYTRYTFNQTADFRPAKIVNIGGNLNYTWSKQNVGPSVYSGTIGMIPLALPYDSAGNLIFFPGNDPQIVNPLNDPNTVIEENRTSRLIGSVFGEVSILKGLKYRAAFGIDATNVRRGTFNGTISSVRQGNPANASYSIRNGLTWIFDNIINYDTKIGDDHNFSFTLLQELQKIRGDTLTSNAENLSYESQKWYSLQNNALSTTTSSGGLAEFQLLSYMGRVNYSLMDKYNVTLSVRNDNSSVFTEGHKGLWFPSAALAWKVDAEPFMDAVNVLNSLKLRVGYGSVGNSSIRPYQGRGLLTRIPYNWADNPAAGFGPGTLPLPDLTWERTNALNAGVDFGLWKNRITGTVDVYQSNTTQQIQNRSLPAASGFPEVLVNLGKIRNRGIEISLSTTNINQPGGWRWITDFMFTKNKEEIVELFGGDDQDNVGNQWFLGWPIRTYYDWQQEGVFQYADTLRGGILADYYWKKAGNRADVRMQPGRIRAQDTNGDTLLNEADKVPLGSEVPKWIGSVNSTLSYKGFDLGIYVYVRRGSTVRVLRPQTNGRQAGPYLNYWTPTNPTNEWPQVNSTVDVQPFWQSMTFRDGSFVRVRSISLTYRLPKEFVSRYKASSSSIFFNALNPFLWSKVEDVDPETLPFVTSYPSSRNSSAGPTSYSFRSFVLGVRLGF
ncbi:TonB-dependent receptor [Paraflavisolibacter sp. H34]|uniref:SusC/RagA family TonB-linked outer membrane protein n=1 Tax=Huijunlia imazamoxiresistens TaxID=3127457 RepID=UPI0030159585